MRRTRATSPFAIFWWLWFSTHNSGGSGVSTITATALAIDGDSHVLVANGNGQTEVLSNAGVIVSTTQGSTSASPSSIAIDNSGNIWTAKNDDQNRGRDHWRSGTNSTAGKCSTEQYPRSKALMSVQRNVLALVAATAAVALTGCALSSSTSVIAPVTPVAAVPAVITGTVFGGQQPISGATIQLYAAGGSNYGVGATYSTGTSLLGNNTVTTATDGTGSFTLSGKYTCPANNPNVYIVATGGSPSTGTGGTVNHQLALMAALGPCLAAQNGNTKVTLNELTTVASVYALSGFMTGIANIGTSGSNATGLNNAFAAVNKLVNISTGTAGGPALPANATLPVAKINTLADILAACVNSPGGTAGQSNICGELFTDTTVNSVAPTDTITAMMNIAQHPNLTSDLWNIPTGSAPFQPSLSNPFPSDFSIVVTYSGGGLSTPKGIAVDTAGNVWTANSGNNSVSEFSNAGAPLSGTTGYPIGTSTAPAAIAVDVNGNAWVANSGNSTVSEVSPGGATVTPFSGGNMSTPVSIAIDASNNIWIANSGNASVTEISNAGAFSNYTGAGIAAPTAIAINPK